MTPNDVNVKMNTIVAAAVIAGRISGNEIAVKTRHLDAPRVAAASSMSVGRCSHSAPTTRTTTARLNATWAPITAPTVRSTESGSSARKAAPITTVGSTNIAVSSPSSTLRPAKSNRATTYAGINPTATVIAVDTTACHSVNHTTSQVCERPSVARTASPVTASATSVVNGQT